MMKEMNFDQMIDAVDKERLAGVMSTLNKDYVLANVVPILEPITEENKEEFLNVPTFNSHGIENMNGIVAVPKVPMEISEGRVFLTPANKMCMQLGITSAELEKAAFDNLNNSKYSCKSIEEALFGITEGMEIDFPFPMDFEKTDVNHLRRDTLYCISNDSNINGANAILNSDLQEKLKSLGDYYILPSSRHEVLVASTEFNDEPEMLVDMVKTINAGVLDPKDKLADNVYKYDSATGKITSLDNGSKIDMNREM